jgi:hypothetical protein
MSELPLVLHNAVAVREAIRGIDELTCHDPFPAIVEVARPALNQRTGVTLVEQEATDDE